MENSFEIIRKDQYFTSQWSGGTTTELLIYPKTSKYSERNFKWRISSAKVDADESIFTHLPGITRHLMLIEGKMSLEHDGKYISNLTPFKQDKFLGNWTTKSTGKATDFNLMLSEGCTGSLDALSLKASEQFKLILKNNSEKQITEVFYVVNGSMDITINEEKLNFNQYDLIYITASRDIEYKISLLNSTEQEMTVIRTTIIY
jgi:environmental stress-induced protein Ves